MYTADQVTDWILQMAQESKIEVSQMKLQKLLYYVQGYSLGMTGERAFGDTICANTHGPVVENMRVRFRHSGSRPLFTQEHTEIPEDIRGLIACVLRDKGKFTAKELRDATHEEAPFFTTEQCAEISAEKMREHFTPLFWNADEEDEYTPSFDTEVEEKDFLRACVGESERSRILSHEPR